jgi:DNA-binding transcriptional LysR family regulator
MDLRHARVFVAVADLGTVSAAARQLRVAQPALSRQIRDLEHELGLDLFDRVGRRLLLTSAGEQLVSECRGLVNHASAVGERARLIARGDAGILKVAASPQHIESVLCHFLHRYAKAFPKVQVEILEASGGDSLQLLERGEIHLSQNLLRALEPGEQRFGSLTLEWVELLAACHPEVRLGDRRASDIRELADHPLLLLDTDFMVRRTFDAACRLAGLKPHIRLESRTPHTLLALAETGHGVAVIPSQFHTARYRLRIVPLTFRGRPLREPLALLWDKRRPLPRYAEAFRDMLAAYMKEVFPITRPRNDLPLESYSARPPAQRRGNPAK